MKNNLKRIEIRNEMMVPILATACRSKLSGRIFIHIGEAHGSEVEVKPLDYAIIEIKEVPY